MPAFWTTLLTCWLPACYTKWNSLIKMPTCWRKLLTCSTCCISKVTIETLKMITCWKKFTTCSTCCWPTEWKSLRKCPHSWATSVTQKLCWYIYIYKYVVQWSETAGFFNCKIFYIISLSNTTHKTIKIIPNNAVKPIKLHFNVTAVFYVDPEGPR